MASITDRLNALEELKEKTADLPDRIKALEDQLQEFDKNLTAGEKQYKFLKDLPDNRGRTISENTKAIAESLDQFNDTLKQVSDPFNLKLADLSKRVKAIETAIGI